MGGRNLDGTLISVFFGIRNFLIGNETIRFTDDSNGISFFDINSRITAIDIDRTSLIDKIEAIRRITLSEGFLCNNTGDFDLCSFGSGTGLSNRGFGIAFIRDRSRSFIIVKQLSRRTGKAEFSFVVKSMKRGFKINGISDSWDPVQLIEVSGTIRSTDTENTEFLRFVSCITDNHLSVSVVSDRFDDTIDDIFFGRDIACLCGKV